MADEELGKKKKGSKKSGSSLSTISQAPLTDEEKRILVREAKAFLREVGGDMEYFGDEMGKLFRKDPERAVKLMSALSHMPRPKQVFKLMPMMSSSFLDTLMAEKADAIFKEPRNDILFGLAFFSGKPITNEEDILKAAAYKLVSDIIKSRVENFNMDIANKQVFEAVAKFKLFEFLPAIFNPDNYNNGFIPLDNMILFVNMPKQELTDPELRKEIAEVLSKNLNSSYLSNKILAVVMAEKLNLSSSIPQLKDLSSEKRRALLIELLEAKLSGKEQKPKTGIFDHGFDKVTVAVIIKAFSMESLYPYILMLRLDKSDMIGSRIDDVWFDLLKTLKKSSKEIFNDFSEKEKSAIMDKLLEASSSPQKGLAMRALALIDELGIDLFAERKLLENFLNNPSPEVVKTTATMLNNSLPKEKSINPLSYVDKPHLFTSLFRSLRDLC